MNGSQKRAGRSKKMKLPMGATRDDFFRCKNIIFELTGDQEVEDLTLALLNIVYAKGGDYSKERLETVKKTNK